MSLTAHSSNTITNNINALLKSINHTDELLVFGYIRNTTSTFVPHPIINYILLYRFLKIEYFEFVSKYIECSNDGQTISNLSKKDFTSYGSYIVDCRSNTNCIYQWEIKVNKANDLVAIGLNKSDKLDVTTTFYYEPFAHYACDCYGYTYGNVVIGTDLNYVWDNNDIVIMSLNSKTNKLRFWKRSLNKPLEREFTTDFIVKPLIYRLAVYFSGNSKRKRNTSVTLQEFKITNKSF
eukprot:381910_1